MSTDPSSRVFGFERNAQTCSMPSRFDDEFPKFLEFSEFLSRDFFHVHPFSSSESNGYLNVHSSFEEVANLVHFELEIVFRCFGAESDLFGLVKIVPSFHHLLSMNKSSGIRTHISTFGGSCPIHWTIDSKPTTRSCREFIFQHHATRRTGCPGLEPGSFEIPIQCNPY